MPAEDRYAKPLDVPPGRLAWTTEEPIRAGSLLWVLTDPHRGHEVAYNRWYERDHFYAGCMIGAWNFAGARWVATRRHKAARLAEPAADDGGNTALGFPAAAGSYVALYFVLADHHDEWVSWGTAEVHELYAADRGFAARTHYNTGTYRHVWRAYRDPDPVPLELALDHRYAGLVAQFTVPAPGVDEEQVDRWFDAELPRWLPGSPVATVSSWAPLPLLDSKPDFVPTPAGQVAGPRLQIYFTEDDPLASWDHHRALADRLQDSGLGRVVLAAPFVPTVVGTDRYADELW
jgi:hypothetical protein